jgi:serine/threonine-protein kinase RsbT
MTSPVRLEFKIEGNDYLVAGAASNDIKNTLKMLGISSDVCRRAAIITYEAEMNLVIHANGGTLKAVIYEDRIELYTSDEGPGIPDIEKAMTEGFTTASDQAREMGFGAGMGLPNIKRNSDEFEIESTPGEGTKLTSKLYFNRHPD